MYGIQYTDVRAEQGRSSLLSGTGAGAGGPGVASSDPSYGSVESTSAVKVACVVSQAQGEASLAVTGLVKHHQLCCPVAGPAFD